MKKTSEKTKRKDVNTTRKKDEGGGCKTQQGKRRKGI